MARVRVPTPLPVLRASRAPIRTNFSALEPRPAVCRQARRRVKGTSSRSREGRKRIRRIRIATHQRPVRGKQDEERATQRLQVSTRNSKKKRERERERERVPTFGMKVKLFSQTGPGGGGLLSPLSPDRKGPTTSTPPVPRQNGRVRGPPTIPPKRTRRRVSLPSLEKRLGRGPTSREAHESTSSSPVRLEPVRAALPLSIIII
jgi:hypothetical protein